MTGSTAPAPASTTAWDEPRGATPRGTVVVVPGRGESPAAYQRFGARIAADGWKVRLVPLVLAAPEETRDRVTALVADPSLPGPTVLLGVDAAAPWASRHAEALDVDGVVVAGAALPGSPPVGDWQAELDARSACPVHRGVLEHDVTFARGALDRPLPAGWPALRAPARPTLVVHGDADPLTPVADAVGPFVDADHAVVKVVHGGRHDVLNDAAHRAVAATVVLFLESLRLGRHLPVIVGDLATDRAAA